MARKIIYLYIYPWNESCGTNTTIKHHLYIYIIFILQMTSGYTLSVFTVLILCTMYSSVMARGCYLQCGVQCFPCRYYCRYVCSFGKRSSIDKGENTVQLPFPDKFENYDLDKSGGITLEELAKAISGEKHTKETVKAFLAADTDGDKKIDCSEFKAAPYLFAHDPTC